MNDQYLWWLILLGLVAAVGIGWVASGPVPGDVPGDDEPAEAAPLPPALPPAPTGTPDERGYVERYEPRETRWPERIVSDDPPEDAASTSETP